MLKISSLYYGNNLGNNNNYNYTLYFLLFH